MWVQRERERAREREELEEQEDQEEEKEKEEKRDRGSQAGRHHVAWSCGVLIAGRVGHHRTAKASRQEVKLEGRTQKITSAWCFEAIIYVRVKV